VRALPFQLLLITDWSVPDLLERLSSALSAGPGVAIQHRHPEASGRQFFDEAVRLRERFPDAPLFINRRLDVALAVGASLHLPAYGLLPSDVRGRVPLVSVAVHSAEEAQRAEGADFALVSPVFEKGSAAPLGVEGFQRLAAALPCPAFALGGVREKVPGAAGHAVISAVLRAADPKEAAAKLLGA
jgi:thiamine-phosphate pyrophosphorylase